MTPPLNLTHMFPGLLYGWVGTGIATVFWVAYWGRGRQLAHVILAAASLFVGIGALQSIFAIILRANALGLVSGGLKYFALLMTLLVSLAVVGLALVERCNSTKSGPLTDRRE